MPKPQPCLAIILIVISCWLQAGEKSPSVEYSMMAGLHLILLLSDISQVPDWQQLTGLDWPFTDKADSSVEGLLNHEGKACMIVCPVVSGSQNKCEETSSGNNQKNTRRSYADVVANTRSSTGACSPGGEEPPDDNNRDQNRSPADKPVPEGELCPVCLEIKPWCLKTSCCSQNICPECAPRWKEPRCFLCRRSHAPVCVCPMSGCQHNLDVSETVENLLHMISEHFYALNVLLPGCGCMVSTQEFFNPLHTVTHHTVSSVSSFNGVGVNVMQGSGWIVPISIPLPISAPVIQQTTEVEMVSVAPAVPVVIPAFLFQLMTGPFLFHSTVYTCQLCLHASTDPDQHLSHMCEHMSQQADFLCPCAPGCPFVGYDPTVVFSHVLDHHLSYECPEPGCGLIYQNQEQCQHHYYSRHPIYRIVSMSCCQKRIQ